MESGETEVKRTDGFLVMPGGEIAHYFLPGSSASLCGCKRPKGKLRPWQHDEYPGNGRPRRKPPCPTCRACQKANINRLAAGVTLDAAMLGMRAGV